MIVQKGKVSASAWQDRKLVMVMATNCQPSDVGEVPRKLVDGSRMYVPCPQAIILYNLFMGGVDTCDQLGDTSVGSAAGSFTNKYATSCPMLQSQTASSCRSSFAEGRS